MTAIARQNPIAPHVALLLSLVTGCDPDEAMMRVAVDGETALHRERARQSLEKLARRKNKVSLIA